MEINLGVGDIADAVRQMGRLAALYDRIAGTQAKIRQSASGLGGSGGTGGGGATAAGGGGIGGGSSIVPARAAFSRGPFQRLLQADQNLLRARATGNPMLIADAKIEQLLAQKAADRGTKLLSGPTPMDRISKLVASTRFGAAGGRVMPLVGQTLGALGIGAEAAGPIGIGIAGIIAAGEAAKFLAHELGDATGRIRDYTTAGTLSGARGGELAALTALGLSPSDAAGMAASLRERLSSDPLARSAGSRLGLGIVRPRPYGDVDEAGTLERALRALRKITDAEQQLRYARMLGLESALELIRVSDGVFEAEMRDARVHDAIMDPATQQSARDFNAQLRRSRQEWDDLRTAMMKPIIPAAAQATGEAASGQRELNRILNSSDAQMAIVAAAGAVYTSLRVNPLTGGAIAVFDALRLLGKHAEAQKDPAKSMDRAAEAMNKVADVLQQGMHGGADRARAALGAGWQGDFLDRGIKEKAIRYGAFGL